MAATIDGSATHACGLIVHLEPDHHGRLRRERAAGYLHVAFDHSGAVLNIDANAGNVLSLGQLELPVRHVSIAGSYARDREAARVSSEATDTQQNFSRPQSLELKSAVAGNRRSVVGGDGLNDAGRWRAETRNHQPRDNRQRRSV